MNIKQNHSKYFVIYDIVCSSMDRTVVKGLLSQGGPNYATDSGSNPDTQLME